MDVDLGLGDGKIVLVLFNKSIFLKSSDYKVVITNRKEDNVKDQKEFWGLYVQEVDYQIFIIKI